MDHRISKDMISSGMTPSGEKAQEDLSRTQYGSIPSPSSLMEAYKTMYEHHQKDADGKVIEHEEEEVKEGKMPEGLKNYLMKKGKKEDKKDDMKKEDADLFDLVKSKLIDEGYEEKDAVKIMANLTEDEFNQISEGLPMIAKAGMAVGGALLAKKGLGDMKKKFDKFLNKQRNTSPIGGNTRPGADKVEYGK